MNETVNPRSGPWDVPLRDFVKSKPIVVIIHNLITEKVDNEFHLDYGNFEDRKFLGKLTFWAITNERTIETMSKNDWEKGK